MNKIQHLTNFSKNILYPIISIALLVSSATNTFAQDEGGRSQDIKSIIDKISSDDPIQGAIAVDEAFKSEDPVLKSIVLEKSLQSKDRRIRNAGFKYISEKVKEFMVETSVSEKDIEDINSGDKKFNRKPRGNDIIKFKTTRLKIEELDSTGNIKGTSNTFGSFAGSIASGDLTIVFHNYWGDCGYKFKNFDSGYLNGFLNCSGYSYAAKALLP